jgi:chromosome segregation ATPase
VHVAETQPPAGSGGGTPVSRASLQADLANAQERNGRLDARVRQLEKRLSELLGEQAWRESGLGAPQDIDALHRRITELEQTAVDLTAQLQDRTEDLEAARGANRDLMTRLNSSR